MDARTNSKAQCCEQCGLLLQPGAGRLEFVPDAHDDDDFGRVGTYREGAHWVVYCLDTADCQTRTAVAAAERQAKAAAETAERASQKEAWEQLTAGLSRASAKPDGWSEDGTRVSTGTGGVGYRLSGPNGQVGWYVSHIDDGAGDSHYWLVTAEAAADAEGEKARLHRVYQWWRPNSYGPESYPGPGVPLEELTADERAEVASRQENKLAWYFDQANRLIPLAVKTAGQGDRGCMAYELLVAAGCEVELVVDPDHLASYARDCASQDSRRDPTPITVTLRATLPPAARNKNGTVKAAVEKKLPRPFQDKTANRTIKVRVEYA